MSFGARALIRLAALKHNLNVVRAAAPGAKVMAVIKANAYGHGMVAVAESLPDVDALAVARVPEAVELRKHSITTPIILLAGVIDQDELQLAIANDLQTVVHCPEQIDLLNNCDGGSLIIWLKIDTGMNRLGFSPDAAAAVMERLNDMKAVKEIRLMTHFSSADELDSDVTRQQMSHFAPLLESFDGAISVANSAGMLGWPDIVDNIESERTWVRPGIALFGVSPFADKSADELGLRAVMQFEARLIAVKQLAAGSHVGYKRSYRSDVESRFGIISAGYGDGYSRHFKSGTPVLLNGRRVTLIGDVSMDMIAVDLGPDATDQVGDVATLWGDGLPVEEVAPWADAIPYELVCGVMNREASKIIA